MEQKTNALYRVSCSGRINLKTSPDNIKNDLIAKGCSLNGANWTTNIGGDLIINSGSDSWNFQGWKHTVNVSGNVVLAAGSEWGAAPSDPQVYPVGSSGTCTIGGSFINHGGVIY